MNVEDVPGSSFWGRTRHEERNELFDRARINLVRGTGGTHHGTARLVPRGRLPRVALVTLRFAHRNSIT
jgi:hypothetical protein